MYYWTTNRYFKVETALLQFLSNLDNKNSFVYWTICCVLLRGFGATCWKLLDEV